MSSPIRACLLTEGEIQHRGGPSASGAAIEGLDLGSSAELPENVGASSVALKKVESASVPISVTMSKTGIDPLFSLTSSSVENLILQDDQ